MTQRQSQAHPIVVAHHLRWLLVPALLGLGACSRLDNMQLPEGTSALHRAAAQNDVSSLRKHLTKDVDLRGAYGWTPLHFAAIYDAPSAAQLLIKRRAHLDALDNTSMTPLHWAARKGNSRVVRLLLNRGAEVMSRNIFDMTPLHEARTVEVAELLLAKGAEMEARNIDGMTPLHVATTRKVAQFLIQRGANLNAKAKDGRTPMDMPPVPKPRVQ